MKVEVNEKFFADIEEEGTIMDFIDGEFCFVYKDSFWCEHEINGLRQKPCVLHFGSKYNIPFFSIHFPLLAVIPYSLPNIFFKATLPSKTII